MEEIARKKSDMGKIGICIIWCALFFLLWERELLSAKERKESWESEEFVLSATFSYQEESEDGSDSEIVLRAHRDFALRLNVTARTREFSGYVNVLMQNEGDNHVLYQHRIEILAAGESISCQMLLPMNLMTAGLYLTLTNEEGEVFLEQTVPIETVNYGMYEMTAVFDQDRGEEMYQHFASFGNRLVEISESEMECGARAMDALEIIVTEEAALVKLEEKETIAFAEKESASASLKEWVRGGKTLVVGASSVESEEEMLNFGLQEKEVLQELVLHIGNYEATRENVLATNEEIKKQYGREARTSYIGDSMTGGQSVNDLSDRAVSLPVKRAQTEKHWWNSDTSYEVLWQERGVEILRCYHVGKGNVLVFAVPITVSSAKTYPLFYYRMVEMVLENLTQIQIDQMNNDMYGYSNYSLYTQLPDIRAGNDGISVFPYILILFGYILVLIPAVFLLLRHFEKTKYLWGVLPLLSFTVMGAVYITGSQTRITQPYCTYIDIMDYTKNQESVYFSLSAPTNEGTEIMLEKGANVRLAETRFRAYEVGWIDDYLPQENVTRAREYRAAVCALPEGTKLCLDTIRAFSNTSFYAWGQVRKEEGKISVKITARDKIVAGTVKNTTAQDFQEVYICSPFFAVRVSELKAGEEVLLEHCKQVVKEDGEDYYGVDFYLLMFDASNERNYTEYNMLNQLYYEYILENKGETYILALPKEEGRGLLGAIVDNPGSNGIQVFVWGVEDEVE